MKNVALKYYAILNIKAQNKAISISYEHFSKFFLLIFSLSKIINKKFNFESTLYILIYHTISLKVEGYMKKLSVLFLMIAVLLNGQILNANEAENVCDPKTCLDGKKLDHTGDW